MIKIGILGEIGSGKSYIAKCFRYPVFNADNEVSKLYKKDKKVFNKLKKILPNFFYKFPIDKNEVSNAILSNDNNLKKIVKIVHYEIKKKLKIFLKKNQKRKAVVLDIPLLLENKINSKKDILIFIESKKKDIYKNLIKRKNYNKILLDKFKKIQLPIDYKRKKSQFIVKNDFTDRSVKREVNRVLKYIL